MSSKVLIVEDDRDFARMLEICLLDIGSFDVEIAHDGESALEKMRNSPPDVITLDLMMPGKSGSWVFNEMKEDPALENIPVIILSALTEKSEGQILPQRDSKGIISLWKPVDPNILVGAIQAEIRNCEKEPLEGVT